MADKKTIKGKSKTQAPGPPSDGIESSLNQIAIFTMDSGNSFRLRKERIVVGSVDSADVRISESDVSAIHAVVELEASDSGVGLTATIYDLASEAGVKVNGKKIVTGPLRTGDIIQIGSHKITFSIDSIKKFSRKVIEGRNLVVDPDSTIAPLLVEDDGQLEEIFIAAPPSLRALEVVQSWMGTIVDVEHFTSERAVTIGTSKSDDFNIEANSEIKRHPIVKRLGGRFFINLTESMTGVFQRGGELETLDVVRAGIQKINNVFPVELHETEFAKVQVGAQTFYLSYTEAPPRLRRRRLFEKDPFFTTSLILSLVFSTALLVTVSNITVPDELEVEEVPERVATVLYQPEKYTSHRPPETFTRTVSEPTPVKPKPVPKPPEPKKVVQVDIKPTGQVKEVPKTMSTGSESQTAQNKGRAGQNQRAETEAKEGQGARARGESGDRGSRNAAPSEEKKTAAMRPSPRGGTGRGGARSQVPDQGNIDVLKGASKTISDLLGGASQQLGAGGKRLQGFGGFNTEGDGGLALGGAGTGGGGTADTKLGGLSDRGQGGGRVGTGLGAAGQGGSIIGGMARQVAIRTGGPEETVVMGSIDAGAIEAAILAHRDEFVYCYEKEINAGKPSLAGRILTSFVIGPSGNVTTAGIASSSMNDANVERCVVRVLERIKFPIPEGGGVVQVRFPFKYAKAGG